MDTTINTQPNDQLTVDPNLNQATPNQATPNQATPNDLAVTKDMPKSEATAAAKPEKDENAEKAEPGEMTNKREQLHRRVIARVDDLEKELANLQGNAAKSEHAIALQAELDIAKDAMSGGWDHVGEMEAARLSKWLEASQTLVGIGPADPASAGANLDPMSGQPAKLAADTALPVDGSDTSVKATENPNPADRTTP
jgi:hypothetical protein